MGIAFGSRLKHAWNAFASNRDPTPYYGDYGSGYSRRPDRVRFTGGNQKSFVISIYNRIAMDIASLYVKHCKLNENGQMVEVINSGLNRCLNVEANIDQTGFAFKQDAIISMFDEGVVALVPIDTTLDPKNTGSYDICSMRTGKITEWYPKHVKVRLYNDRTGEKEEILLPKSMVAIVENPLYAVINEPNSTAQRLIRKLNLLDAIDEQSGSGKLDLLIHLPYATKTESRRKQADSRRKEIEDQLKGPYGIAYVDGTEHVTQLNRPVENNLMGQIQYLTAELLAQLGITQSIMDGTADEQTMLNYYSRTIEPIITAFVDEMKRKFLTKTAQTQGQSIKFFRDPFKLVPVNNIADIADKFTRNEIMTSNEIRDKIGMMPSKDPKADQLINSTIRQPDKGTGEEQKSDEPATEVLDEGGKGQNGEV